MNWITLVSGIAGVLLGAVLGFVGTMIWIGKGMWQ